LLPNNIKNNESDADQLLSEIFLNQSNHSRAGRNADDGKVTKRMETDLNIDLTVVPRRISTKGENDDGGNKNAEDGGDDEQQRLLMEFTGKSMCIV
jgi:hypothetical protein